MAKKKKTNEDLNESQETNDASDNFGLPDIEYKPLDRVEEVVIVTETTTYEQAPQSAYSAPTEESNRQDDYNSREDENLPPSDDQPPVVFEEEERSNSGIIIAIVVILVLAVAGFLVYKFVYVPRQLAKQEQLEIERVNAKKLADAEAAKLAQQQEEERKRREAEEASKVTKPAIGTIEKLSSRTGRYYVVISSAIDDDLIMDKARQISSKGVSTKIVPPFAKWKFFRLTIGDFDTYALAQTSADASKGEYGGGVWVVKY